MMKYIFVSIAVAVCWMYTACSTLKERSASHQSHITAGQAGSTLYQSHYDSAGRYWYFRSDSLFYYHPDSGLYAYRGALAVRDAMVSQDVTIWSEDSSRYDLEENSSSDSRREFSLRIWGIVGIVLALGMFFVIRYP